jgi:hypothetical protein
MTHVHKHKLQAKKNFLQIAHQIYLLKKQKKTPLSACHIERAHLNSNCLHQINLWFARHQRVNAIKTSCENCFCFIFGRIKPAKRFFNLHVNAMR